MMTLPKTVLVVDDSTQIRRMLQVMLESRGYQVFQAWNGMTAIKIARRVRPAVILMDLEMPMMDGYEACQILKSDPETADLKVVILSTTLLTGLSETTLDIGADAFLSKPAQMGTLHACLEQVLSISA
ncbi:MAG: response regulator [Chloroflexota bacterium]